MSRGWWGTASPLMRASAGCPCERCDGGSPANAEASVISPYPLVFTPILLDKVWGGRRLERFGKQLPEGRQIGESWELADLAATSSSGAGGAAARSVIANGPMAGKTLHDAIDAWRRDLMGDVPLSPE